MNKYFYLFICFLLGVQLANAQIGINTLQPNASSVLDIKSNTKGLLIPCMSSDNRLNILNPADGLMVYDTIQSMFYYWDKAKSAWHSLNPWSYRSPVGATNYSLYTLLNSNIGIGRVDPREKLHVAGSVYIDTSLYVRQNMAVAGNATINHVTALSISGNGSGITNVNAANLGGHPASYYGTATDVTALQTGKADKTELYTASNTVTVSSTSYCGTQNTVGVQYATLGTTNVQYTQVGNLVFVSGVIYFTVTSARTYICAQLSNLPAFPEEFGIHASGASLGFYNSGYQNQGGSLQFHAASGYGNILTFYRVNYQNFNTGTWRATFQFFYHTQ